MVQHQDTLGGTQCVGFTPLCLDVVSLLCIMSVLIISLYFSLALWKLTAVIVAYFSHVRKKKKKKHFTWNKAKVIVRKEKNKGI
jgi:hypothetical protein